MSNVESWWNSNNITESSQFHIYSVWCRAVTHVHIVASFCSLSLGFSLIRRAQIESNKWGRRRRGEKDEENREKQIIFMILPIYWFVIRWKYVVMLTAKIVIAFVGPRRDGVVRISEWKSSPSVSKYQNSMIISKDWFYDRKLYFLYYCNECNMIMGSPPPLRPLSASPRKRWAGDKTMIASRTNEMRCRRSRLVIKLIFISVDYAETFVAIPSLCWECEESINISLQTIPLTTYAEAAGRMTSLDCPTQSPEGESVKDY